MMSKRIIRILAGVAVALAAATAVFISVERDPAYRIGEWLSFGRYGAFEDEITAASARNAVDPLLVKAVIWQESRFHPDKLGAHGERGLMQVTEPAAQDWVKAEGIETFAPTDLLDPKTNIEVGTWYLSRAMKHWSAQTDPLPFALGEYNAGRSRVKRWSGGAQISAEELSEAMDIASTRAYIAAVRKRYDYYKAESTSAAKP